VKRQEAPRWSGAGSLFESESNWNNGGLVIFSIFRARRHVAARGAPKTRPGLETLEDRKLPSVDVSLAAQGLAFSDTSCSCEPPDPGVAAGPTTVVDAVNTAIAYYDKDTGARTFEQELPAFFNPLGGVLHLTDPVVSYDELTGQFVLGILDTNSASASRFDFAVSNDSDPNDGWSYYRYDMNDDIGGFDYADYPKIGYNADAWVVSFNMFPTSGPNHVDTLSIDKATRTGYRFVVPGDTAHYTMAPATMHDANPGDPIYFVEAGINGGSAIKVDTLANELSDNPTLTTTNVPVAAYSNPPNAAQPGGTVNTDDDRVFDAALRDGLLVAAHTVRASATVAHARWYEFNVLGGRPATLFKSGEIDQGAGVSTYFPTIDINAQKHLGMTFMESSSTENMSMYVTGLTPTHLLTGMQTPALTLAGTGRYTGTRAGDYSAATVDATDGVSFWATTEYKGSSFWNTGLAHFTVSPPSESNPVFGQLPAPVDVLGFPMDSPSNPNGSSAGAVPPVPGASERSVASGVLSDPAPVQARPARRDSALPLLVRLLDDTRPGDGLDAESRL
jgi:hypothetical protein